MFLSTFQLGVAFLRHYVWCKRLYYLWKMESFLERSMVTIRRRTKVWSKKVGMRVDRAVKCSAHSRYYAKVKVNMIKEQSLIFALCPVGSAHAGAGWPAGPFLSQGSDCAAGTGAA